MKDKVQKFKQDLKSTIDTVKENISQAATMAKSIQQLDNDQFFHE